jgi:heme/copper-type cytochrome/quinol oxidase subunit 3
MRAGAESIEATVLKESLQLVPLRRDHYQASLVFAVFIASLTMFFLAALSAYVLIRRQGFHPLNVAYTELHLPPALWISAFILVAAGIFLERACWFVRRQMLTPFKRNLNYAAVMTCLFVLVQAVGMSELYAVHFAVSDGSNKAYGMSFTLAFVHAMHVLGGLVFLIYVMYQARRQRYDHERFWAVKHCAGYWHFLDLVWLAMLVTFFLAG